MFCQSGFKLSFSSRWAGTIKWLFFPSFVAGVLPLFGIWWQAKRCAPRDEEEEKYGPLVDEERVWWSDYLVFCKFFFFFLRALLNHIFFYGSEANPVQNLR